MTGWDPHQYGRFADERARPFHELTGRIGATAPAYVVDLGCGTGELTATLAARWPEADVEGVDRSAAMLASGAAPGVRLREGDITTWTTERPVDVLVANAALQWVPDHLDLLPRLVAALAPGGWLAFQVPGNFIAPSHVLLAELRRSPRWADRLTGADRGIGSYDPGDYLDGLARLGCAVDAWETTYSHVLPSADAVLEWTRGTALRPVLDRLDAEEVAEFEAEYAARLRAAYPRREYGTVFAFRRVFVVATKP